MYNIRDVLTDAIAYQILTPFDRCYRLPDVHFLTDAIAYQIFNFLTDAIAYQIFTCLTDVIAYLIFTI